MVHLGRLPAPHQRDGNRRQRPLRAPPKAKAGGGGQRAPRGSSQPLHTINK